MIKKCPFCGDSWIYITKDDKYRINCLCGYAFKRTPKCVDREAATSVWNGIASRVRLTEWKSRTGKILKRK